jgi:hypothetical protein
MILLQITMIIITMNSMIIIMTTNLSNKMKMMSKEKASKETLIINNLNLNRTYWINLYKKYFLKTSIIHKIYINNINNNLNRFNLNIIKKKNLLENQQIIFQKIINRNNIILTLLNINHIIMNQKLLHNIHKQI